MISILLIAKIILRCAAYLLTYKDTRLDLANADKGLVNISISVSLSSIKCHKIFAAVSLILRIKHFFKKKC